MNYRVAISCTNRLTLNLSRGNPTSPYCSLKEESAERHFLSSPTASGKRKKYCNSAIPYMMNLWEVTIESGSMSSASYGTARSGWSLNNLQKSKYQISRVLKINIGFKRCKYFLEIKKMKCALTVGGIHQQCPCRACIEKRVS